MNKYAVAYISFFHNELKHKLVLATSPFMAALDFLVSSGILEQECINDILNYPEFRDEPFSLNTLNKILYEMESTISVIEV